MNDAIKRATNIIKDLSDFSRPSNMQLGLESLNGIIENSLLLVQNDIKQNNIRVSREFKDDISKANLDKNRISQVFINLFMNAIQAMPEGGELKITTDEKKYEGGQKCIVADIQDTGTGISKDIINKIFDPFFSTKEVGKGTGLGLSIVRNIIEAHNGYIRIENRKDRTGTKAVLEFRL